MDDFKLSYNESFPEGESSELYLNRNSSETFHVPIITIVYQWTMVHNQ